MKAFPSTIIIPSGFLNDHFPVCLFYLIVVLSASGSLSWACSFVMLIPHLAQYLCGGDSILQLSQK